MIFKKNMQHNKKRVLLCGFYGAPNLGDELMLQTILGYLKTDKQLKISVMISHTDFNFYKYYDHEISYIVYPQTHFDFEIISEYYDVVIFGGGALIDDTAYNKDSITRISLSNILIELAEKMLQKNKACHFLGLSCNSKINDYSYIKALQEITDSITSFSVRDQSSLDVLKALLPNADKIKLIDDIILSNPYLQTIAPKVSGDRLEIGIILIFQDKILADVDNLMKYINNYLVNQNYNYQINLIPFYMYCDLDKKHYEFLIEKYPGYPIKYVEYDNSIEGICTTINNLDCIISMRYHGALLAALLNKRLLTIVYDEHPHYPNKMNYIYEKYTTEKNVINLSEVDASTINVALEKLFLSKPIYENNSNTLLLAQKKLSKMLNNL